MQKLIQEVQNEGLVKLIGQQVTLMCACYFYTGKLIGVNDECVLLEDPAIIYETGAWSNKTWADCQSMGMKEWYVMKSMVESFGVAK